MEVVLARTAGFCFGVKRAVDMAYRAAESGGRIYTYGPIIHNEAVVNELEAKGVGVIASDSELKDMCRSGALKGATVIIRAHGVGIAEEELLSNPLYGITTVDATCPLVKKVQETAREYYDQGYWIIIAGDPGHPEVRGILSRVNFDATVIDEPAGAEAAAAEPGERAVLIAQTTYNIQKFNEIVEILQKRIYHINVVNTICRATELRQREASELSRAVDAMIVIGGIHSSNTQKLYDICSKNCILTQYIGSIADLDESMLSKAGRVGITAGASTPYKTIEEVLTHVRNEF